jgi:hypothetical protein
MKEEGYAIFPNSAKQATYRSGVTSSTIDFVFHRQVQVKQQDIARIFIAQHKPITCSFGPLPIPADATPSNMTIALGTSSQIPGLCV